ncbi:TetR/AcrR family transcriptional regulator [Bifidobacterium pseudocatenulatum]|uniref:TetR/AcrR family transcriptional regulator n=2 Tax=Bifidobacterium pseudocatenulatum TaxID=28026 RepID=UPI0034A58982
MLVYSTPPLKERHMARNAHPEVTRQRILDAAKKLFAQKGYEHTTIQDILDELEDLSKGAIYHHFKKQRSDAACAGRFRQRTTSSPSKSRGWLAKRIAKTTQFAHDADYRH